MKSMDINAMGMRIHTRRRDIATRGMPMRSMPTPTKERRKSMDTHMSINISTANLQRRSEHLQFDWSSSIILVTCHAHQ